MPITKLRILCLIVNKIIFAVSHSFGFGLMDAAAMVEYARNWTIVPDQHRCEIVSETSTR